MTCPKYLSVIFNNLVSSILLCQFLNPRKHNQKLPKQFQKCSPFGENFSQLDFARATRADYWFAQYNIHHDWIRFTRVSNHALNPLSIQNWMEREPCSEVGWIKMI